MKLILTFTVLAALFNASFNVTYKPESYMPAIAATGANCVRIQWLTDDKVKEKGLNDNSLKNVIQQAINNKLIPILELWTFTGSNEYSALQSAGNWWASKIPILKQFEDKLLINIANEWVYVDFFI